MVAGTQSYALSTDFGKELYAVDTTNNTRLDRTTFNALGNDYAAQLAVIWQGKTLLLDN